MPRIAVDTEVQRSLEPQWRRIEIISEGSEDEDIADGRKVDREERRRKSRRTFSGTG